jgi:hypothetical protein
MIESEILEKLKAHIVASTAILQRRSNAIAMTFATDRFNPQLLGDVVAFDEAVQLMLDQTFHSLDNLLARLMPSEETKTLCCAVLGIRKNLTEQIALFEQLLVSCQLVEPVTV